MPKSRYLIVFILSLLLVSQEAAAEFKLKDLPDDHWAAAAVYDLVRLGVTKGYPDGTYRGGKPITRYETAIFLSKLAKAIGGTDLKTEIKSLRDQIVELKKDPRRLALGGSYLGAWRTSNLMSTSGGGRSLVTNYRLVLVGQQELADNAKVKVTLDTMDYGFLNDGTTASASRGLLASGLLALESELKVDLANLPVNLKVTYGSGPKQHSADPTNALASEVGLTYVRPNTGVQASTKVSGADVSLGYYSLQSDVLDTSGKINTGQISGSIGFNLPAALKFVNVALSGDYISRGLFSSTNRDVRATVNLLAPFSDKVQATAAVGLAGRRSGEMMIGGGLNLNDLWDTGTVVAIRLAKIGSEYISPGFSAEEFYFAGYDNFNRPLIGGTVQVGGALTQTVNDRVMLSGKGDLRLAGNYQYVGSNARFTAEGGISYNLAPNTNLDAAYRVHQDKGTDDTSDLATLGLQYKF